MDEKKSLEQKSKSAEKDALNFCGGKRVNVTKNKGELDAIKKEYEKQQKQFYSSVDGQSYEDIRRRKDKKEVQVQKLEWFINCQTDNLDKVSKMVVKRKKFFVTMRSTSMRGISRDFTNHMDNHNLEGKLTPNYKNASLDVYVRPKKSKEDHNRNSSQAKNYLNLEDSGTGSIETDADCQVRKFSLASLSGGERSKTLVCLINALWNVQQPPFRCLDEWDVFLDHIARKNIELMLVKTALSTQRQYFFISPQGSMFADNSKKGWQGIGEQYKDSIKVFSVKKEM